MVIDEMNDDGRDSHTSAYLHYYQLCFFSVDLETTG